MDIIKQSSFFRGLRYKRRRRGRSPSGGGGQVPPAPSHLLTIGSTSGQYYGWETELGIPMGAFEPVSYLPDPTYSYVHVVADSNNNNISVIFDNYENIPGVTALRLTLDGTTSIELQYDSEQGDYSAISLPAALWFMNNLGTQHAVYIEAI